MKLCCCSFGLLWILSRVLSLHLASLEIQCKRDLHGDSGRVARGERCMLGLDTRRQRMPGLLCGASRRFLLL